MHVHGRVALAGFATAVLVGASGWHTVGRAERTPNARTAVLDTTILKWYKWRSIGPDRGGRSIAISGVKGRPKEGYFGATGGGLWKTTDGGQTWAPVTDGQIRSASVGA